MKLNNYFFIQEDEDEPMQPLKKPPEPGQPDGTAVHMLAPEPGQLGVPAVPVLAPVQPGVATVPVQAQNDNPDDDDMCPDWTELTSTIGSFFNRDCILTLIAKHLKCEIENQ